MRVAHVDAGGVDQGQARGGGRVGHLGGHRGGSGVPGADEASPEDNIASPAIGAM